MPTTLPFSFDGRNAAAQRVAERQAGAMVKGISDETLAALRSLITRSIREGIPPLDAARMIRGMIGLSTQQAMAAMNYRESIINSGLSPDRVNTLVDRYTEKKIRERAETIARTECLPSDTLVDAAVVWAVHRRPYKGDVIKVRTCDGRDFSATPNHPMLTHRGWVSAREVTEGDSLICDARQKKAGAFRNKYVEHPPSTLGQIFDAAAAVGVLERRRTGDPDFHGDGRQGEVEIARPYRELVLGCFAPLYEPTLKDVLTPADLSATPFCSSCRRLLEVNEQACLCDPALANGPLGQAPKDYTRGYAERFRDALSRLAGQVASRNSLAVDVSSICGTLAAPFEERAASLGEGARDASAQDDPADHVGADAHLKSHGHMTHAGPIQLDRVESACVVQWSGHVFNLSTPYGYYTINGGVYTGNTMNALNTGALESYAQAQAEGLLGKDAKKEWMITGDDNVCTTICEPMDGIKVPLGASFNTPAGPMAGPPAHPRCRCATVAVP